MQQQRMASPLLSFRVRWLLVLVMLVLVGSGLEVSTGGSDHKYKEKDLVPLFANKVGPFKNPSVTYRYYNLPFCRPDNYNKKREDLGEVLNGDWLTTARYELKFRDDKTDELLCEKTLKKDELEKFRVAVKNEYYFQMYYDDLPIWGFVGKFEDGKYYLYTHVFFEISYYGDQVIEIKVSNEPKYAKDITADMDLDVKFIYTAKWKEVDTPFDQRMEKYFEMSFKPQRLEIHWFFINSCVTVLLLTGFLATILMRVLKNDFIKYSRDEEALDDQEETGWKYIHGDVFKYPPYNSLFCAVLRTGLLKTESIGLRLRGPLFILVPVLQNSWVAWAGS